MRFLRHAATIASLTLALAVSAVPAKRIYRTFTQPDGSEVSLRLVGDEFAHYYITDDGRVVISQPDGGYYFARVGSDGMVAATDRLATNSADRTAEQNALLAAIDNDAVVAATALRPTKRRQAPSRAASDNDKSGIGLYPGTKFPSTGSPRGLIILVEYSNVKFNLADPNTYFKNMLTKRGFSQNGATGSALDYFVDASCGRFTPQFDVYGPVTLPNIRSYYGGNDAYGEDKKAHKMVSEGCRLLDDQIDFSLYDEDKDGYVDNVYVIYADQGEASYGAAETVWPHQFSLSEAGDTPIKLDGKYIDRYACSNEWENNAPDGIGTFVHEFSHVLGLPDLYITSNQTGDYTPGEYSVLDYGPYNNDSRTPPTYSAFERNALGWLDVTVLDQTPSTITLQNILDSNHACLIRTASTNEFFLLENRQYKGWDKYLPGHGMLVWHIDYVVSKWSSNSVNNTKSHQYVDLVEANNTPSGTAAAMLGYPFPGSSYKTEFTANTTPALKSWAGDKINIPITNIDETNGVITFDVCGGVNTVGIPTLIDPTVSEIGDNFFVAKWAPVPDADDYIITVETDLDFELESSTWGCTGVTRSDLPSGWSTTATSTYTSAGNFGAAKPSIKLNETGHYIQTCLYSTYIVKVEFWAKANGSAVTNPIEFYAVDGNTTELLGSLDSWSSSTGKMYTFEIPKPGVDRLRIQYNKKTTGTNMAIDDITIYTSTGMNVTLEDYENLHVGNVTNCRIDRLIEDVYNYKFTVRAVANGKVSNPSQPMHVDLLKKVGVDLPSDQQTKVSIDGRTIACGGLTFDVVDIAGRTVAHGVTTVDLAPGIYVVCTPGAAPAKVAIK